MSSDQLPDDWYRVLVESALDYAIFMLDPDGRVISWNSGAQRLKGYSPAEIIGEHCSRFYLPEDITWGRPQHVLAVASREGRCQDEGWRVRQDGSRFWADVVITAMRDAGGNLLSYSVITRDLTAWRSSNQSLTDHETRLRNIVNNAVDGIITIDQRGTIESVNPAVERIFGYSGDQLIGQNVNLLMPNPYHDAHDQYLDSYLTTGQRKIIGIGREVLGRRRDGSIFPVDLAVSEVWLGDRQLFTGIIRDISERKRSEQALRDREARHRAIFETAVDGIVTIDEHGIIETVNPATERLFGYAASELIGRNVNLLMPSPFQEQHGQYLNHYIRTGEKKIIGIGREVLGRRKDGTTFPMDLAVSELYIGGKRMFTGLIHDLTDRKRAEEQRDRLLHSQRAARAEAERASKAKDDFLAALSHELRTPLTPVLLTLSLMERDPNLPEDRRRDLEVIRRNVEVEARLIDDLLDLTRVITGKMILNSELVDVHQLIRSADEIQSGTDGIEVVFELSAREHHINADPARMQQVFWNLLSNAHKFTQINGGIVVRTSNPRPGRIRVEVSDTGRGIDPQLLPKIFNAFEQGDPKTARRFGGLGLGLAICKAIIEAHGGHIDAASGGKGRGATFVVEMACTPARVTAASPPVESEPRAPVRPLKILLVEDHEPTLKIVSLALRHLGHHVRAAGSVRDAIATANRERFDIMISDIGLPDGTGYQIMEHVSGRFKLKGIALSGYGMNEDIHRSISAGFSVHLTKPIDLERLVSALDDVAQSQQVRPDR